MGSLLKPETAEIEVPIGTSNYQDAPEEVLTGKSSRVLEEVSDEVRESESPEALVKTEKLKALCSILTSALAMEHIVKTHRDVNHPILQAMFDMALLVPNERFEPNEIFSRLRQCLCLNNDHHYIQTETPSQSPYLQ